MLFRSNVQLGDENYDYWPRGRVTCNTTSKCYNIYHDACLQGSALEKIREAFKLEPQQVRYLQDPYYTCHACMKKLSDDDLYDIF